MKHTNQTIIDQDGIELNVGYDYENGEPGSIEPDAAMGYIELTSVEVVIKGKGIDILPYMVSKQVDLISHFIAKNHYNHIRSEKLDLSEHARRFFMK